jgi:hypothetical protein
LEAIFHVKEMIFGGFEEKNVKAVKEIIVRVMKIF